MLDLELNPNSPRHIRKTVSKSEWLIFCVIIISAVLSFVALKAQAIGDRLLRIYFMDVGQGDAILIQNFNGNQVLIDGGPDNSVLEQLAKVMPFNDRSIDLVVLTHPHKDHIIGLIEVLKRYEVDQILENSYDYKASEYDEWIQTKSKLNIIQAVTGEVVDLGGGVKIKVIFPGESESGKYISNANNTSVVLKLEYGNESILLTGDIESSIEKKLAMNGSDIDSDFLKLAHHGSKTSSIEQFINAVSPVAAFIEVGAGNTFGHPAQSTIERLEKNGIKYYRTDKDGTIELIMDGQSFSIKGENI
jgi:competence protein ComEC